MLPFAFVGRSVLSQGPTPAGRRSSEVPRVDFSSRRRTFSIVDRPSPPHRSRRGRLVRLAVRRGLTHRPKFLPCQYIYDETGSELFEEICEQPEYYVTRVEDEILRESAPEMVAGWADPPVMIELGSGSSTKTRRLIEAALETYGTLHYVPIDISPTILEGSAGTLIEDYPDLRITGFAGDYEAALRALDGRFRGPKLLVFLGSSLGNFDDDDAQSFVGLIAGSLRPSDRLLLGADMVKDASVLESAYDDASGVTARFASNILSRINRELDADFDLDRFGYRARFVPDRHRVEMHLVSQTDQQATIRNGLGLTPEFAEGETIHVENSHKYTRSPCSGRSPTGPASSRRTPGPTSTAGSDSSDGIPGS